MHLLRFLTHFLSHKQRANIFYLNIEVYKHLRVLFYLFIFIIYLFVYFVVLGLHLEPLLQPFFVMGFFEIGSHELFAQDGFKL
jgi:hypothetical protein